MTTQIITNHHKHDILYWNELTKKERAEFDWLETDDEQQDASFFRYRGWTYCIDEFMRLDHNAPDEFAGYDGYSSDSFFSGVLVKYPTEEWGGIDTDHVICATYIS